MRVTVTGWTNPSTPKNNTPWEANYESTFPTGLIENKITDESGKEVSESEWMNGWNKTFYQTLRPTAGNEDNIEIVYAEGVEEEKSFNRGDEEGVIYGEIEKPTYTGATGGTVNENGVMETTFNGVAQKLMPSGMEELLNNGRLKLYAVDEEGNYRLSQDGGRIEKPKRSFSINHVRNPCEIYAFTEEDYEQWMALYEAASGLNDFDSALADIITETAGACFAGDKTLDETVELIQNRASLYISEQS